MGTSWHLLPDQDSRPRVRLQVDKQPTLSRHFLCAAECSPLMSAEWDTDGPPWPAASVPGQTHTSCTEGLPSSAWQDSCSAWLVLSSPAPWTPSPAVPNTYLEHGINLARRVGLLPTEGWHAQTPESPQQLLAPPGLMLNTCAVSSQCKSPDSLLRPSSGCPQRPSLVTAPGSRPCHPAQPHTAPALLTLALPTASSLAPFSENPP